MSELLKKLSTYNLTDEEVIPEPVREEVTTLLSADGEHIKTVRNLLRQELRLRGKKNIKAEDVAA
tara:strand:+ start:127 stop:321 length:195 start_codon:yes stop_codon:yes gene_type:complete